MILGITGHRPKALGCGYEIPNPTYTKITQALKDKFLYLKPNTIISGMALGVDWYAALTAIELGIPFIAAVPFEGQDKMWPEKSKKEYKKLLDLAEKIVIVSPGSYSAEKMQIRNQWMVDNSDALCAVWNGEKGGTGNCVQYAQDQILKQPGYLIHRINPTTL